MQLEEPGIRDYETRQGSGPVKHLGYRALRRSRAEINGPKRRIIAWQGIQYDNPAMMLRRKFRAQLDMI